MVKKEKKERGTRIERLVDMIRSKPHKIKKRESATIILPNKKVKPLIRRSEIFNKEYEKEKNLLGWK